MNKKLKVNKSRLIMTLLLLILLASCGSDIKRREGTTSCDNGENPLTLDRKFYFPGTLLFSSRNGMKVFALDGETHEIFPVLDDVSILDSEPYQISPLSPDGKWIMVSQLQSAQDHFMIQLIPYRGSAEVKSVFIDELVANRNEVLYWNQMNWVNDSFILGYAYKNAEEKGEITLFDPFRLEWKKIKNMFTIPNFAMESGYSVSADLSKILYVNKLYHLVLYDLIDNRLLWEYTDYDGINPDMSSAYLRAATWSNDGKMLASPISRENGKIPGIFIMNYDGKVLNFVYTGNHPLGLSWSHDGKFVSFYENRCTVLDCSNSVIPVIRLYRVKDGLTFDLCSLSRDTVPVANIQDQKIVWSPDNQFIAYGSWDHSSTENGIIIQKLDDQQIRIFKMANEDLILLGWSQYKWQRISKKQ